MIYNFSLLLQAKTVYGALHALQVSFSHSWSSKKHFYLFVVGKKLIHKCLLWIICCRHLANFAIITFQPELLKFIRLHGSFLMNQGFLIEAFWLVRYFTSSSNLAKFWFVISTKWREITKKIEDCELYICILLLFIFLFWGTQRRERIKKEIRFVPSMYQLKLLGSCLS